MCFRILSRRFLICFFSFCMLFLSGISLAMPSGSYTKTCSRCYVSNDSLKCKCKDKNSMHRSTSVNYRGCRNIVNNNGVLQCNGRRSGGGHHGNVSSLPRGNYKQTCKRCYMKQHSLICMCKDRNQNWRWSKLDGAHKCRNVVNHNSRLRCS